MDLEICIKRLQFTTAPTVTVNIENATPAEINDVGETVAAILEAAGSLVARPGQSS